MFRLILEIFSDIFLSLWSGLRTHLHSLFHLNLDCCMLLSYHSMVRASSKTRFNCRSCSSLLVQSDKNCIRVLSYLGHLEELGLIISECILNGMLEAILIGG